MKNLIVRETIKNEENQQKGVFFGILLGTLCASLLRNMLARKGVIRAGEGAITTSQRPKIKDGTYVINLD